MPKDLRGPQEIRADRQNRNEIRQRPYPSGKTLLEQRRAESRRYQDALAYQDQRRAIYEATDLVLLGLQANKDLPPEQQTMSPIQLAEKGKQVRDIEQSFADSAATFDHNPQKGKDKWEDFQSNFATDNTQKILAKIREATEASQPRELTDVRFGNQTLAEIFPKMNLDHITDPAEKRAYLDVLKEYAQALHDKSQEIFQQDQACQNILQHYSPSQIYYKWYGTGNAESTQLVAIRDTRDDTISVSSSNGQLKLQFGINTHTHSSLYPEISMQEVLEHLRDRKKVQFSTYLLLKPLYKCNEAYKEKTGPIGLYLTDNYTRLAQDFGGYSSSMTRLYNVSSQSKIASPWTLPKGAVQEQPQVHRGQKSKYGDVFKLETPEDPS